MEVAVVHARFLISISCCADVLVLDVFVMMLCNFLFSVTLLLRGCTLPFLADN